MDQEKKFGRLLQNALIITELSPLLIKNLNPFVSNAPFFYHLKTSENLKKKQKRANWEQMG